MRKDHVRSNHFLITIPNDMNAPAAIKQIREAAKSVNAVIKVRGRCKKRRAVFALSGRTYTTYTANNNDIHPNTPEAPFCYAWALYMFKKATS